MSSRVFAAAATLAFLGLCGSAPAAELAAAMPATSLLLQTTTTAPKAVAPAPVVPRQTAADRCASLEQQFTAAAILHFASKKIGAARKLAEEGTDDCTRRKFSLGTRRLVAALETLGVTPRL
jgi:hypothetical protein